jgi:anti-sigma-K factor RskA
MDYVVPPIDAYVPPGQARTFALPRPQEATGAERIALTGDDEPFDNLAHFVPPTQERPLVLWLGGDVPEDPRQPLFFLRRAYAETPRVAVRLVSSPPASPVSPEDLAGANLIVVADALPAETAAAVRAQAEAGRTVLFMVRKGGAAEGATLGWLAGRGDPVRLGEIKPGSYAMWAEIDFQHPLLAPFADPRFSDFTKIHFWRFRRLDPAALPGARVVVKFDSGDPALLELPLGKGRLVVLASGWHPEDSQLAVSSKFVPLVWSLLEGGGGLGVFATHYVVGDTVAPPADGTALTVRGPGGESTALAANSPSFAGATRPGSYEITGGRRPLRFAVNLDPNESRTAPLGAEELEQLGVPVARSAGPAATSTDQKTLLQGLEAENRQKLWRWFIAATLAVLLIESALAGWTARRAAASTPEVTS